VLALAVDHQSFLRFLRVFAAARSLSESDKLEQEHPPRHKSKSQEWSAFATVRY
jgi:hypothetical protein